MRRGLLEFSSRCDWPDHFQAIASESIEVIVQWRCEIGVTNDEFHFVADF